MRLNLCLGVSQFLNPFWCGLFRGREGVQGAGWPKNNIVLQSSRPPSRRRKSCHCVVRRARWGVTLSQTEAKSPSSPQSHCRRAREEGRYTTPWIVDSGQCAVESVQWSPSDRDQSASRFTSSLMTVVWDGCVPSCGAVNLGWYSSYDVGLLLGWMHYVIRGIVLTF